MKLRNLFKLRKNRGLSVHGCSEAVIKPFSRQRNRGLLALGGLFLPHSDTHQKAHLISSPALACYIALFIVLQMGLHMVATLKPGVLGLASNVSQHDLISLTNAKRAELGLPALSEDPRLDSAAYAKGQNMFAENYWAHYSPSGKDPWGFILGAGYRFTAAGENLARNFYNSPDIVNAWMASPTHRDNIVNAKYKNIGIAVLEGNLSGQPTVLVVQEFGTPVEAVAQLPAVKQAAIQATPEPTALPTNTPVAVVQESTPAALVAAEAVPTPTPSKANQKISNNVLLDPYLLTKNLGLSVMFLIAVLTLVDLYVLRRRAVVRLTSRHLPHLTFLAVAASAVINLSTGSIL